MWRVFFKKKSNSGPKFTFYDQQKFSVNLAIFNTCTWFLHFLEEMTHRSRYDFWICHYLFPETVVYSEILGRSHTRGPLTWRENCSSVIWNITVGFERFIGHVRVYACVCMHACVSEWVCVCVCVCVCTIVTLLRVSTSYNFKFVYNTGIISLWSQIMINRQHRQCR